MQRNIISGTIRLPEQKRQRQVGCIEDRCTRQCEGQRGQSFCKMGRHGFVLVTLCIQMYTLAHKSSNPSR